MNVPKLKGLLIVTVTLRNGSKQKLTVNSENMSPKDADRNSPYGKPMPLGGTVNQFVFTGDDDEHNFKIAYFVDVEQVGNRGRCVGKGIYEEDLDFNVHLHDIEQDFIVTVVKVNETEIADDEPGYELEQ